MVYYEDLINITKDYLGPAAKRFIDRQISFHLEKDPNNLNKEDIKKLAEWVRVALGLLTEDKKSILEAVSRIKKLAEK